MGTLTRKQFLRGSAIGAAALAATATGPAGLGSADDGGHVFIHFHGVLERRGATVAISVDVAGQKDGLAGAGWDSGTAGGPNGMVPSNPVGACYYTAAGTLDEHVVKLDGMSLFTNRPVALADAEEAARSDTRADGRLMKAEANLKSGDQVGALCGRNDPRLLHGDRSRHQDRLNAHRAALGRVRGRGISASLGQRTPSF